MKIIDITRTAQDAPLYPGTEPVKIEKLSDLSLGGECNESVITASSHAGTHADAFSHFIKGSDLTIDKMDLALFCGDCRVITVPEKSLIKTDDIRGKIEGARKVVLHGGGKSCLCHESAEYLLSCGVHTVVTDALSVAEPDSEAAIHTLLANAGVAIIENVVLDNVTDGKYLLFAFPVKYGGCDGAPVRAVLITGQ